MLKPLQSTTLPVQVSETLRKAIFAGNLHPGEILREAHIAQELQVSQVPVREALMRLEHLGLVVRTTNKNTIVTKLSSKEVKERTALREVLEQMAFVEAAPYLTGANITELKKISREISRASEKKDYFEAAQSDLLFHRYVWERSENEMLYRTLDNVTVPLFAFISILRRSGMQGSQDLNKSHDELITALESADEKNIENSIAVHVNSSYEVFLQSGVENLQILAQTIV